MKGTPINQHRDLLGQHSEPLAKLQIFLRLNGVFIPWLHFAFISDAHSDEDIEEILRVHQISVEVCLQNHQII